MATLTLAQEVESLRAECKRLKQSPWRLRLGEKLIAIECARSDMKRAADAVDARPCRESRDAYVLAYGSYLRMLEKLATTVREELSL